MERTNLFLVCFILFISAQSSSLAVNPITPMIGLFISIAVLINRSITIDIKYIFFSLIYFLFSTVYYFIFDFVDTLYIFYFYALLTYGYLTIKILKYDFFKIFHDVLYALSIISLPFFFLQLINLDLTFKFVGFIQHSLPFLEYNNNDFANNLFFTIDKTGAMYRNSGFAWEPKGFSNFLVIGIVINMILFNFKINRKLIILLVGLMTTFSTAGYVSLIVCFTGFLFVNKKIQTNYTIVLLIMLFGIFISGRDFIFQKIQDEIFSVQDQTNKIYDKRYFKARSLGRFGSFLVDYNDFIKHPITGYGIQRRDTSREQLRTQSKYNYTKLVRVNGFSDRLATFGLVGMSFFIISIYKGFRKYLILNNCKGAFWIMILFLMIEFATNLLTSPFWMTFLFLFLIDNRTNLEKSTLPNEKNYV